MGEKAFIKKLKGSDSAKSLVEVQNDVLVNVVSGLPNSNNPAINIIDNKDSAIIVAKNAQNWVVSGENLLLSSSSAYISEFTKSGAGLWIDSDYTFPASTSPTNPVVAIINPNAKWILRLCGKDLMSANETIDFTLVVKIGSTNISNINLSVARQAGVFCKELAIDFSDSLATMIKAEEGDVLTLQLICGDSTANATIFNGKTALTLLQRKVDGKSVASDTMTFDDVEQELDDINETLTEHISDTDNPHSVTKTQVGLGNVDNTSDADKPISDATQDALDLKADLSGATFTGDISATNLSGTNTGDQDLSGYAELSGATFTGDISANNLSGTNTGDQDLSGYALDNSVVHLSGNETIADVKTFSSFPVTPSSAPTTDYEVANKKYVDDNAGGGGSGSSLSAGQILFGLYDELPSAAYVWGDAGKQELNNASTNYSNLVDNITGGLIPSGTIAAWDAAYAAHPDGAVSFWGYDPANNIIIVPNIPRGYAMTAAGSSANLGTVLQNASPNITGTIVAGPASGAFVPISNPINGIDSGGAFVGGWGNRTFNASKSSPAYGRDSTTRVRNDQIQMRVLFYVGAEVSPQEASQITAANVLSELHSKLDNPSTWSNDDFASMRVAMNDLDWAHPILNIGSTTGWTAPSDGIAWLGNYNSVWSINGVSTLTNWGTDSNRAGTAPFFLKKGDILTNSLGVANYGERFVPFKNATGTNNLILGINYYGKFATTGDLDTASASLIETPLGKGRWALVGNDIDGYVRYYTVPTDGSFSEFTWEEGAPDTTDGDYVVETYVNGTTWYRKYKSGWVEQGGFNHSINLSSSGSSNMISLPVTMVDTNYTTQATLCNSYGGRQVGIITTASTTTQVNVGGYASSSGTSAVNWEVKGMAA